MSVVMNEHSFIFIVPDAEIKRYFDEARHFLRGPSWNLVVALVFLRPRAWLF